MTKYVVSICQGPDCTGNGSNALVPLAERCVRELGLASKCSLKRGGCYGLCEQGANVIVRVDTGAPVDPFASEDFELNGSPGETHYKEMDALKLERVMREHVAGDSPIIELQGATQTR
ncbi:MAG: (2Fe-2S) ferredoxin domain-containing protein [Deltaproteobacteria bacterium]|nr:(2Fe-2S) ferredoxin domain-containing protein [Deltaproteobacteria bacterium]